jgi:hypothetical protein
VAPMKAHYQCSRLGMIFIDYNWQRFVLAIINYQRESEHPSMADRTARKLNHFRISADVLRGAILFRAPTFGTAAVTHSRSAAQSTSMEPTVSRTRFRSAVL